MDNIQKWGTHYDVHSLYGHSMALVTDKTLKTLFPGKVGKYARACPNVFIIMHFSVLLH